MNSLKETVFGALQNKLGRFSVCAEVAIKLRNQLNGMIAAHLNDGIDMELNGELWLINRVAPKAQVFIDVGANIGAWSKIFLSKMTGSPKKGLLFEPSSLAVACLNANFRQEIKDNLVEVISAAVCEKSGTMDFYMEKSAGETSSLISKHSNPQARKISVVTTTIDAEMEKRNLKFIDFLKIDAEGYDLHVLKGAENCLIENTVGVIQFEYNHPWVYSSSTLVSALDYLDKHDFKVYLLKRDGLYNFNYAIYGDYFHYSNFVAVAPGYLTVQPLSL